MKAYILTLFFVLISLIFNAQNNIEWEIVGAPDSSKRVFQYLSSSGMLILKDETTDELYLSNDYGENWKSIGTHSIMPIGNYYSTIFNSFREDEEGNIYFASENSQNSTKILKIDKSDNSISSFLTLDGIDKYSLSDFNFMENGDIVVGEDRSLRLYDISTKNLKKTVSFSTHHTYIYLDKGYKSYIDIGFGASNELQEFDKDLNLIGDIVKIDNDGLIYSKGRFLSRYYISDDGGKSWVKIFNSIDNITKGHDGKIFATSYNGLYFSTNNGSTYNKINNPQFIANFVYSTKVGDMILVHSACNIPKLKLSKYIGQDWSKVKEVPYKKPAAHYVVAGLDQNILISDNCGNLLFKIKNEKNWNLIENENFINNFSNLNILQLPDGTFYNGNNESYIISNDFKHFSKNNIDFYSSPSSKSLFIKNDKLILIDYDSIKISNDFVNISEAYMINKQLSHDIIIPTANKKALIYNIFEGWLLHDYLTGGNQILIQQGSQVPFTYMETGYRNANIYGVNIESIGSGNIQSYFYKSIDQGISFTKKPLNANSLKFYEQYIYVDHLENIFILSEKNVLMSSDEGETWTDITPTSPDFQEITGISVSYDNYIYLSTKGLGVIKSKHQLASPFQFKIKLVEDQNKNCVADQNETKAVYGIVSLENSYSKPIDNLGEALFYTYKDKVNVTLELNEKIYSECNSSYSIDVNSNLNPEVIPIKVLQECADLKVGISANFLRRCFDNTYYGQIRNEGNVSSENTSITVVLDPYFEFISTTLSIISQSGNVLVLSVPNLSPNEVLTFNIVVKVNCESPLGQLHCIKISPFADNICVDPSRTLYEDCQENIGSWDPNDKAIFVSGKKDVGFATKADEIEYLIRFQNTGTDTAFTVRIEDNISSVFDIMSIRPTAASHDFTWEIKPGRNLLVTFKNINLVDSFKNEANSHGFIKFSIKLSESSRLGDTLQNQAGIYFDFNEPVITNNVETVNGFPPVNTIDQIPKSNFIPIPNPVHSTINIESNGIKKELCTVVLYNMQGKEIYKGNFYTDNIFLDLKNVVQGNYIVHISSASINENCKITKL